MEREREREGGRERARVLGSWGRQGNEAEGNPRASDGHAGEQDREGRGAERGEERGEGSKRIGREEEAGRMGRGRGGGDEWTGSITSAVSSATLVRWAVGGGERERKAPPDRGRDGWKPERKLRETG